eukprot:Nitzschia sp. Nitz4//scaffold118_size93875//69130//70782//NITZ4_004796-RA/size93875-processed-gene-0.64-mRNA-1//-1//CDS//3329533748//6377//frame0
MSNNDNNMLASGTAVHGNPQKQLVVLAGPQRSGMQQVQQFFVQHASNYRSNQRAESLTGYSWPYVSPDQVPDEYRNLEHDQLLDVLVQHYDNETLVNQWMETLTQEWNSNDFGLVLGSEYLDQDTQGHAIGWIQRMVNAWSLHPHQVHIVMKYETPRMEHWARFYANDYYTMVRNNATASFHGETYTDWVCENTDSSLANLYSILETSMNPLGLAKHFREQDWMVSILDMDGVDKAQQDISHVIGCRILNNATCHQGWLTNLTAMTDASTAVTTLDEWEEENIIEVAGGLQEGQWDEVEGWFTDRDCAYRNELMHDEHVRILFKTSIWQNCSTDETSYYDYLADSSNLLLEVQQQLHCSMGLYQPLDNSPMSWSLQSLLPLLMLGFGLIFGIVQYRRLRKSHHSEQVTRQVAAAESPTDNDVESNAPSTRWHSPPILQQPWASSKNALLAAAAQTKQYPFGDPWSPQAETASSLAASQPKAGVDVAVPYRDDQTYNLASRSHYHDGPTPASPPPLNRSSVSRYDYEDDVSTVMDFDQIDLTTSISVREIS